MAGCGSIVVGNKTVRPDCDCRVVNGSMVGCGSILVGNKRVGPGGDCRVDNGRLWQYSGW